MANAKVKDVPGGGPYITNEHRHSPHEIDLAIASVIAFGRADETPTVSEPFFAFA